MVESAEMPVGATNKTRTLKLALSAFLLLGLIFLFFSGFQGTRDPRHVAKSLGVEIPTDAEAVSGSVRGFGSHQYSLEFRLPSSALPSYLAKLKAQPQDTTRFEGPSPLLRRAKVTSDTQVMDWTTGRIRGKVLVDLLENHRAQVRIVASD